MNEIFVKWEHDKQENIITYRDKSHGSVVTGNMSPTHHTSWFRALDDSREHFLAN